MNDPTEVAELNVADVVGRLMHFWGFKRPMGRVWTVLYLSPHPLSAQAIGERLKMSAGAVSMTLNALEKWGAVHRTWIPGERRDYFSAEDDIWKMVRRVMQERELGLVRDFSSSLAAADEVLGQKGRLETAPNRMTSEETLSYKRERLDRLRTLSAAGETLLAALVEGAPVNPKVLVELSEPPAHTP